jgi:hypothetical protein
MTLDRARATMRADYVDRADILSMIHDAFMKRNPDFDKSKKQRKIKYGELIETLRDLQHGGKTMPCSEQISLEAKWRLNYTDDWAHVDRRLSDLEASLDLPQPNDLQQQADGSWGPCYEELYSKLEPTVDALQGSKIDSAALKALTFMAPLKDPKWVANYLYRLQISDIVETGRNVRAELGAVQSAMSQLIFKDELRDILQAQAPSLDFAISEELETTYVDYVRQTQHPRTGYWGAWYRFDDQLFVTHDLSFTFHVIHYQSGNVENWPQIVDSTFLIKNLVYPFGWKPDEKTDYSDHNNYDVVMILFHGWSHMSMSQKSVAQKEIAAMLNWCLTKSVQGDGFVAGEGEEVEAYYFGLRFLDRVGFFDPSKRFWTRVAPVSPIEPGELAARLARGFEKLHDSSEESETIRAILKAARCLNQ